MIYYITPCPKPRMTQSDAWKKRPIVLKYRAFKDECRINGVKVPTDGAHVTFHIAMPESWSLKKRRAWDNGGHYQTPDLDNLLKGLLDALYDDDSIVTDIRVSKRWTNGPGKIQVEIMED